MLSELSDEKLIIVKQGLFFSAIGIDAYILEKEIGLKRICYRKEVCRVGFPEVAYEKYIEKLKNINLNLEIYENYDCEKVWCLEKEMVEKNNRKYVSRYSQIGKTKNDIC